MELHYPDEEQAFTLCGLTMVGRNQVPVAKRVRDVSCPLCISLLP